MYRKMFTGMIGLMLLGTVFVPNGRADESDKKTIVTVKQPIQGPGKVLPAGTYVFKLLDSNDLTLVAVFNAAETHLITTFWRTSDTRVIAPPTRTEPIPPPTSANINHLTSVSVRNE